MLYSERRRGRSYLVTLIRRSEHPAHDLLGQTTAFDLERRMVSDDVIFQWFSHACWSKENGS